MEQLPQICELIMLICFGLSWPISVVKSIRTRSTKGKSPIFLGAILLGYVAGITGKIVGHNITTDAFHVFVFSVYCLNFAVVSTDIVLYVINRRREKREQSSGNG